MAMNHGETVEFLISQAPGLLILEEEGHPIFVTQAGTTRKVRHLRKTSQRMF